MKLRRWYAFVSVAASGPQSSPLLEERGSFLRPRMAADLRYTTADVKYYAEHWAEPNYDTGLDERHILLQDPNLEGVFDALVESGDWLRNFSDHQEWDGGGITLSFAGHGREGDGALMLPDDEITSSELAKRLAAIARLDPAGHSLRVVLMLDSCYSGEFLINFIEHCMQYYSKEISLYYLGASCMPDEAAWEDSSLGHGIFTYCWSVRPQTIGATGALGIQPDNSFGPALSIAQGAYGCAILMSGDQNPVIFDAYHLEACGETIAILPEPDDSTPLKAAEMRSQLLAIRDRFKAELGPFNRRRRLMIQASPNVEGRQASK